MCVCAAGQLMPLKRVFLRWKLTNNRGREHPRPPVFFLFLFLALSERDVSTPSSRAFRHKGIDPSVLLSFFLLFFFALFFCSFLLSLLLLLLLLPEVVKWDVFFCGPKSSPCRFLSTDHLQEQNLQLSRASKQLGSLFFNRRFQNSCS